MQKLHSIPTLSLSIQIFTGPEPIITPQCSNCLPSWSHLSPASLTSDSASATSCRYSALLSPCKSHKEDLGALPTSFPHQGKSPSDPKECQEGPKCQGSDPACSCLAQHTIPYNILSHLVGRSTHFHLSLKLGESSG